MTSDEFIARETLADGVYTRLKEAIQRGELADGAEVNQAGLARQYGVSRVPVREALRRLQAEQLLMANPFQRYVVTTLSSDHVLELFDVREELEVFGLRRMIRKGGPELKSAVKEASVIAEELSTDILPTTWMDVDRHFHHVLNGQDTAVAMMIEDLRHRINRYVLRAMRGHVRGNEVLKEHAAILAAMRSGNEERTEKAIRRHISNTKATVAVYLDGGRTDTV